jgi:phage baseplate assembly protein W
MANYDATSTNTKRSTRIFTDLNLDLDISRPTKDVSVLKDAEAIKRSVRNLILTNRFERPFHPEIGSSVRDLLFEPLTMITAVLLQDRISETISNFEPRVKLLEVLCEPAFERNGFECKITFQILNVPQPIVLREFLERVR